MSLDNVTPGDKVPEAFNVIIEIPMNGDPIKYEVDKETGAIFVDRFMNTAMHYPTNYGYVPKTIAGDGDPVDVLVVTPVPLMPGVVVPCRAIGILKMTDEAGEDGKVLAVPTNKILSLYSRWEKPEDLNPMRLKTIEHFFEHYKDLEKASGSRCWAGKDRSPPTRKSWTAWPPTTSLWADCSNRVGTARSQTRWIARKQKACRHRLQAFCLVGRLRWAGRRYRRGTRFSSHAGTRMHVDQFVVAGIAQQGGRSCDFQGLAGNDCAQHLAFNEHVVCFQAGVFDHAGGADMQGAACFEGDVALEVAIHLDALVFGGVEVAIEHGTLSDQAVDRGKTLCRNEAGGGGRVAHDVRAPWCAAVFRK